VPGSQLREASLLSCLDPWGQRACPSRCAPTLHTVLAGVLGALCSSDPARSALPPPAWAAHLYNFVLWSSVFTHQKPVPFLLLL